MSIKPNFAYAILRGEKKYEFRRSIFTRQVDIILLYATAPVGRVLAEFDVCSIISESVQSLWNRTKRFAGIGEELFLKYFQGRDYGHAIEIGQVRPYKTPFCPIKHLGIRPPQSFVYLSFNSGPGETDNILVKSLQKAHCDSPLLPGFGNPQQLIGRGTQVENNSVVRRDFS